MGRWVIENCAVWVDKGVNILKMEPDVFANVDLAQCWRESDDVTIYPSSRAVEHMERLYRWMIRGSNNKIDQKVKEMLNIAKIDRDLKTDLCIKASGADIYVALSYIVYLFLGSISEDLFRRRN